MKVVRKKSGRLKVIATRRTRVVRKSNRDRVKVEASRAAMERIEAAHQGVAKPQYVRIDGKLVKVSDLEATVCRDDFASFVKRFWQEVPGAGTLKWNWHMEVLCEELQTAAERVFAKLPKKHDLVINVPPGTSKSTICSIMFPAWTWTRKADSRHICTSYSHILALDLSRKCRDIVQSDKYRALFGSIELREDQNAKGYFLNKHGGFRYAVGTGGTVTGYHADFIIVDDPINPKEARSDPERIGANNFVSETLSQRKTDKAISLTILIMQRLHQDDTTALLLKRSALGVPVRHINLPAKITDANKNDVKPNKLRARYHKSGLLDPIRLNEEVLAQALIDLGEYGHAGQMLQRPVPMGGGQFKTDMIRYGSHEPLRFFRSLCRAWDKAATEDAGAWTAGALLGIDSQGKYWVLDIVRGQWNTGARESTIRSTAERDGYEVDIVIEQEPGSGGKDSAAYTIANLIGYKVHVVKPTGSKEERATPFSVAMNNGLIHMPHGVDAPWLVKYLNEVGVFPQVHYKDQVDASSHAFNFLARPKNELGRWFK